MNKGCCVCSREDTFVSKESLCILHCDKNSWKVKGRWKVQYVEKFWKVMREEYMPKQVGSFNFRYINFPPLQVPKMKETHSKHADFTLRMATEDFSFWRKNDLISFNYRVDFSFANFNEGALFEGVCFKEFVAQKMLTPLLEFTNSRIQKAHIKNTMIKKVFLSNVVSKSFVIDACTITNLELINCKIDTIQSFASSIGSYTVNKLRSNRNEFLKTKIRQLTLQSSTISILNIHVSEFHVFKMKEVRATALHFEKSKVLKADITRCRLESIKLLKTQVFNRFNCSEMNLSLLAIVNSRFSKDAQIIMHRLSVKKLYMHHVGDTTFNVDTLKVSESLHLHNINIEWRKVIKCDFSASCMNFKLLQGSIQEPIQISWGNISKERLDSDTLSVKLWQAYYRQHNNILLAQKFLHIYEVQRKFETKSYQERFKSIIEIEIDAPLKKGVKKTLGFIKEFSYRRLHTA